MSYAVSSAEEPTAPVPDIVDFAATVYWPGNAAGYCASVGSPARLLYTAKWLALVTNGASLLNVRFATAPVNPVRLAFGWYGSGRARLVPSSCVGMVLSPGSGVYRVSGMRGPVSGRSGMP